MSDKASMRAAPIALLLCSAALIASYGAKLFVELSAGPEAAFGLGAIVVMLALAAVGTMLARMDAGYGLAFAAGAIGVFDLILEALGASHGRSLSWAQGLPGFVAIATLAVAAWTLRRTRAGPSSNGASGLN